MTRKEEENNITGTRLNKADNVIAPANYKASTPTLTSCCSSLLPKQVSFSTSMKQQQAKIHVITVPPKIRRPKIKDRFIPDPTLMDIDDDLFLFLGYSSVIRRTISLPPPLTTRLDLILWNEMIHQPQLDKDLHLSTNIDPTVSVTILRVIRDHWDAFDEKGVNRPVIGYEFCVDTCGSPPVCCRLPKYIIHEYKVVTEQIQALENNKWIRYSQGTLGSMIVHTSKPHQEEVTSIDDFIWRLCVSYCALNAVTKSFTFPIPRCADSIDDFGDSNGPMSFITLDARQGYHQIAVRFRDQEK